MLMNMRMQSFGASELKLAFSCQHIQAREAREKVFSIHEFAMLIGLLFVYSRHVLMWASF